MKNRYAVALGKKGGEARAKKLTEAQRSESARKAVLARWAKHKKKQDLKGKGGAQAKPQTKRRTG